MPVRFIILAAELVTALLIPGPLIKYKKKTDICKKGEKIASVIVSEAMFAVTGSFLAVNETRISTFLVLSLFMMLSAVIIQVDTRCRIIPNLCLFPMTGLAAVYLALNYNNPRVSIPINIFTMLIICFVLLGLYNTAFRNYFGAGDIKYLSVCGLLFGSGIAMIGTLVGMIVSLLLYIVPLLLLKAPPLQLDNDLRSSLCFRPQPQ